MTTVLLVDDHSMVREGLRLVLERRLGYDVVEAGTAREAVDATASNDIGVVLLDVRMPERDGLWTLRELRSKRPNLPVLMLSTHDQASYVEEAVLQGAAGYILKDATVDQLREAIAAALEGRKWLHPGLVPQGAREVDILSGRERDVVIRVAQGSTNEEIASALGVSEKTIKSHLSSIFRKLGVTNRTQAALVAIRDGLVAPPQGAPLSTPT